MLTEGKCLDLCLWVDDERRAPEGWSWARTFREAIRQLSMAHWHVVSLDHDLGRGGSGYDVARVIELMAASGQFAETTEIRCHSANPVGRERIEHVIAAISEARRCEKAAREATPSAQSDRVDA